jgi:hypothetical protein
MQTFEFPLSNNVAGLQELPVLPPLTCTIRSHLVEFPVQSESLIPVKFAQIKWEIPRFSIFSGDVVQTAGFRLHEIAGTYFTDTSLVGDALAESNIFNAKLNLGRAENLDMISNEPPIEVSRSGPVLVLASDEPSNFGSWIYRILPKYLLAREASQFETVLVYLPEFAKPLLQIAGVQCEILPHRPHRRYRIQRAMIPSLPAPHVYLRPEVLTALRNMTQSPSASVTLGERLYVSRRQQAINKPSHRVLVNETELVEVLREHGFAEFTPERHSIRDQMSIFNGARVIVGPGGSNMFGCVFAQNAEWIVDIEGAKDWLFAHTNLFESLGCNYTVVLGQTTASDKKPHPNWEIDVRALVSGLKSLSII